MRDINGFVGALLAAPGLDGTEKEKQNKKQKERARQAAPLRVTEIPGDTPVGTE